MDTTLNTIGNDPHLVPDDLAAKAVVSRRDPASAAGKAPSESVKSSGLQSAQDIAKRIQRNIDRMDVSLKFSTYGKDKDKMSVTVVEKKSGKIVREIPAEEVQRLQERMEEVIGLIFNGNA